MSKRDVNILDAEIKDSWSALRKRLADGLKEVNFECLLTPELFGILDCLAKVNGTNFGMFFFAAIATTSYFLASAKMLVKRNNYEQPMNLFMLIVGPPTSGKSSAFKNGCVEPLEIIDKSESMISNPTSSALTKMLSNKKNVLLANPDGYDVLRLLATDDETLSCENSQLLCKLFSGESCKYVYRTEGCRDIARNSCFCILAGTQVLPGAKIIAKMNTGCGLLERFIVTVPECKLPMPEVQLEAEERLAGMRISNMSEIYGAINEALGNVCEFKFTIQADDVLNEIHKNLIIETNDCFSQGVPNEKNTKLMELVPRFSVALHVLTMAATALMKGEGVEICDRVPKSILDSALIIVTAVESQKQDYINVSK